jgi:hypothetical protein
MQKKLIHFDINIIVSHIYTHVWKTIQYTIKATGQYGKVLFSQCQKSRW